MPTARLAAISRLAAGFVLAFATAPLSAEATPPPYVLRQLSPNGEAASRVSGDWEIDPRGEWIAFAGDVEIAGAEATYAMRRNGSDLHRLSAYGAVGAITDVDFTPDGRRVVYAADLDVDGRREIWSVPPWADAAAAVKLNVAVTGSGVGQLQVAPAGNRVVYVAQTASGLGIWSVPVAGPSASNVRLDPGPEGDEYPQILIVRPDGAGVAFQYTDLTAIASRIFTVPIVGPAASAVPIAESEPGGCVPVLSAFTPDSSRLLYGGLCPNAMDDLRFTQVWSVPSNGPAEQAVSLAGSLATGGQVQTLVVSPDSQTVIFTADKLVDERVELFSVPTAGPAGDGVRLNPSLVANGDVTGNPCISPDSTRVAYIADQLSDERFFPYSVPIDGSSAAVVLYSGVLATPGDAREVAFTPDGSGVVFRMDLAVDERFDLYLRPADGSGVQARITNRGSVPTNRSVAFRWYIHPDGDRVLYNFDEFAPFDERGIGEQRIGDPYPSDLRLDGIPVAGGKISYFELFADAAGIAYRSDENQDEKWEIFTTDLRLFGDGFESGNLAAWSDLP